MERTEKKENVVSGVVGAFLGSLLGVVCIVLIGQMGYVASLSGAIMAVCALKGYEVLGGRLSGKGIMVSCVLILAMTYVGNNLDWAMSAASVLEIGVLEAFRSIGYFLERGVIEATAYWGNLVMLYLFTLVGAVPTIVSGLRERDLPAIPRDRPAAGGEGESDTQGGEMRIYAPAKGWMRGLRVSCVAAVSLGLLLGLGLGAGLPMAGVSSPEVALIAAAACILTGPLMLLLWLRSIQALWAEAWVYVRTGQNLWRVDLSRLNGIDTCRYTAKNGSLRTLRWERLTPEEQERAKAAISRGISLLSSGQIISGGMLRRTVIPMTEPRVEKDTKWYWLVSCPTERGQRKKWTVAKAYPGFTPAPGLEMPQGPVPFRWAPLAAALLAAVAAIGIVFAAAAALNGAADDGFPLPGASDSRPEDTNSYAYHGVIYRVDSAFEQISENVFFDERTEAFYYLTVETGMDEEAALSALTELISDHRTDPTFDRFQFSYLEEPSVLVPLTAADGAVYQHTILSLYFTGEGILHSGIALSEDGVFVTVGATHADSRDVETVKAGIVQILESIALSEEAGSPLGGITEANYQSLFHLAEEYGYGQIGCGYIKAPYEMFGHDAFVDVYLPYGEDVEYLEDGYAIRSAAHGMEVYHTIDQSEGNARTVVEQAYEALAASGVDIFEDGVFETEYAEEYDVAFKQTAYFEDNGEKPRIAFLYADAKQEGHYLCSQITYLPEQMDGDYPALVEELSDVFSLTLPQIEGFD